MIKDIVTDKLWLTQVSQEPWDHDDTLVLIEDMIDTASHYQQKKLGCLGLAANQIGELLRVIVVFHANKWIPMVNPELDLMPGMSNKMHETCLSRPGVRTKLRRHKKIKIEYLDEEFNVVQRKFTGMAARVIQHEVDHLDGKYI